MAMDASQEEAEGELGIPSMAALPDFDADINSNTGLHTFETLSMRIHVCLLCKHGLLAPTMPAHHHVVNKVHLQDNNENDSA